MGLQRPVPDGSAGRHFPSHADGSLRRSDNLALLPADRPDYWKTSRMDRRAPTRDRYELRNFRSNRLRSKRVSFPLQDRGAAAVDSFSSDGIEDGSVRRILSFWPRALG